MVGLTVEIISQEASAIMKQALVLATLIAAVCGGTWKQGLRAHFDTGILGIGFGSSFMYDLPKTLSDAKTAGWTQETRPDDGHHSSLTDMYCHSPPVLCAIYDDNGVVSGLQIALSQVQFTKNAFDMDTQGYTEWTASNGLKYWTIQLFLNSEDYLAIDKAERLASHVKGNTLQQNAVWGVGINHELYAIPNNTVDIVNTDFTVQACVPWMGLHYYYNMSADTECTAESILPWFPLYDAGELVGVGFMTIGSMNAKKGDRDWFEHPAKSAVKLIVNKGPECLYELAGSPGALTMHIYFVDNPRLILCLNN